MPPKILIFDNRLSRNKTEIVPQWDMVTVSIELAYKACTKVLFQASCTYIFFSLHILAFNDISNSPLPKYKWWKKTWSVDWRAAHCISIHLLNASQCISPLSASAPPQSTHLNASCLPNQSISPLPQLQSPSLPGGLWLRPPPPSPLPILPLLLLLLPFSPASNTATSDQSIPTLSETIPFSQVPHRVPLHISICKTFIIIY